MWDERYAAPELVYGDQPNDFLASVAPRLSIGRALCLADGQGRNGVFLASLSHSVTAVDLSAVGLMRAHQLARSRGVELATVHADLANFDLGQGAWDAVVSIWAHTPSEVRRSLHQRMAAALRPGGAFVLEAYRPAQLVLGTGGPKSADFLPTLDELRLDLTDLDLEIARELDREIHEGALHDGISAVVQVLAFRR